MLPKKEAAEHALYCSFAASLSLPVHVLGQPLWLLALSSLSSLGGAADTWRAVHSPAPQQLEAGLANCAAAWHGDGD